MAVGFPHTDPFTTTGTSHVAVIPAPATGVAHIATRISVYNKDTVSHTYTLWLTTSGSTHDEVQKTASIPAGGAATFDQASGHSASATTRTFTVTVDAAATTTESRVTASYIENT